MFERYVEKARRSIFFARYEASAYGSPTIETEHLLLGLLREDKELLTQMSLQDGDLRALRQRVESLMQRHVPLPGSADLPLSGACKRALSYAAKEADKFHHTTIDPRHLMLGLLRSENTTAAKVLGEIGITYDAFADMVGQQPEYVERPVHRPPRESSDAAAESLRSSVTSLESLVSYATRQLQLSSDIYGTQKLKRRHWSRKEALGHLIDWAAAHHQWFGMALVEPAVTAREYPTEEHAVAKAYYDCFWVDLIDTWISLNRVIIHVLAHMPEDKAATPCHIGIEKPVPLSVLAEHYALHNEDIMGQILSKL
jgi:hypothetical protein